MAQKIVRAVELAGEVVEELAKVGQADGVVAQQLCSQFLQIIKARLCQARILTCDCAMHNCQFSA